MSDRLGARDRRGARFAALPAAHSLIFVCGALVLALWLATASASAAIGFCPPGSEAGQCLGPEGIATDFATERAYVADSDNNRIDVFEAEAAGAEWNFLFAFGWGVADGSPEWQKCTAACQAGIAGSGAGQLNTPRWIAVDNLTASGEVYVSDRDTHRINRFDAEGGFINAFGWGVNAEEPKEELQTCTTATGCLAGIAPSGEATAGECQLGGRYQPVAVGPGGAVFVAITTGKEPKCTAKVEKFSPSGECLGETVLWSEANLRVSTLAVDAAEDAYVASERGSVGILKQALGVPPGELPLCVADPGVQTNSLALDAAGHLFAGQRESPAIPGAGGKQVITEYNVSTCPPATHVRRFAYDELIENSEGVAALHTAAGDVLASQPNDVRYLASGGPGPIVVPSSLKVTSEGLGNAQAEVQGEVNPEGEATEYRLVWATEAEWEKDKGEGGDGFEGLHGEIGPLPLEGLKEEDDPEGFKVLGLKALLGCETASEELIEEGKCLIPETAYRLKAVADNGGGDEAEGKPFTTKAPLEIRSLYAGAVGTETASLSAVIDPVGIPATAYLEYVTQAQYEADLAEGGDGFAEATRVPETGELDFGGGKGLAKRSIAISGLSEGTAYRFRALATDALIEGDLESEVRGFTTYRKAEPTPGCPNKAVRAGAAALLPDCRGYELVSPLDKDNGDIITLEQQLTQEPAAIFQSAASGERFTYGSARAFGDAKSAPFTSQYLAGREAGGWSTHAISPPQGELIKTVANFNMEFTAFSEDLCEGWIAPIAEPPLAPGAGAGYRNVYRRTDELCGGESYATLSDREPEKLGRAIRLEAQGFSADGEVSAFAVNDTLLGAGAPAQPGTCTNEAISSCRIRVYLKGPKAPARYACVLPGGAASAGPCQAGTGSATGFELARFPNLTNALAEDGQTLYFTDAIEEGPIYARENPLGEGSECSGGEAPCTRAVSKAAETAEGSKASRFWAAAADGSAAFFTTGNLSLGQAALYRYDLEAKEATKLAGKVFGVAGASEDASRAYLASGEVLATGEAAVNSEGDEAVAGKPNLYLWEQGAGMRFVGTLGDEDVKSDPSNGSGETSVTSIRPFTHNARASADGQSLAFTSEAPLTGYDNTDASSLAKCGEAEGICDNEVFLYDAGANGGAGEILCASCNPSGGRPQGANLGGESAQFWTAARLPGQMSSLYPSRLLSAGGERLFFESQDPLVARDTNGRLDVYQWERAGKGSCTEADPGYSPEAGGCIELVSSGQSIRDSELLDASASGDDVFFTTLSSLYAADYGLVDVYDARVDGGFPAPTEAAPGCEGESCQSAPPAPSSPTPASNSYKGPGDLREAASPFARCNRSARRAKRLARRSKRLRAAARRSGAPAAKRGRLRSARRAARQARGLSRNAKRCRARARKQARNRR